MVFFQRSKAEAVTVPAERAPAGPGDTHRALGRLRLSGDTGDGVPSADAAVVRGRAGNVLTLVTRLTSLGLDGQALLSPALEALAAGRRHQETLAVHRRAALDGERDARRRFAGGEVSLDELAQACATADMVRDSKSSLSRALNSAVAVKLELAESETAECVAERVFPALVKAAGDVVAEVVELGRRLPAQVDSRDAARGAGVLETWLRLDELSKRFADLAGERARLAESDLLPRWNVEADMGDLLANVLPAVSMWLRYESPELLPADYFTGLEPAVRLVVAVKAGAKPGLYTVDDARRRFVVWRNAVLAKQGKWLYDKEARQNVAADLLAQERLPGFRTFTVAPVVR